ncbi:hypothetical protein Tco_1193872 [Tanacetum coccineum]
MGDADIIMLTMEQYLALTRGSQAPGAVKPEIGGNVNFKIKSQFMRELREDTFSGNKKTLLMNTWKENCDINVSLYQQTLELHMTQSCYLYFGLSLGTINTWDSLKNAFIQRYCSVGVEFKRSPPLRFQASALAFSLPTSRKQQHGGKRESDSTSLSVIESSISYYWEQV